MPGSAHLLPVFVGEPAAAMLRAELGCVDVAWGGEEGHGGGRRQVMIKWLTGADQAADSC